ncbi:MAG: alpha/beta fold hydrolase [Candidatus Heimdallarchaeaceae archaeon]
MKLTEKETPSYSFMRFVTSTMWQPQVNFFSKFYEVIINDIRGHGKTGISPLRKYSIELFADDLKRLIENWIL